jgi:hypothetical protein
MEMATRLYRKHQVFLKDMKMGQYKLELNHKNWLLRGYTTQENAGESHNLTGCYPVG